VDNVEKLSLVQLVLFGNLTVFKYFETFRNFKNLLGWILYFPGKVASSKVPVFVIGQDAIAVW